jgi:hypothetical protein
MFRIKLDLGSIIHVIYGILAVVLHSEILFTVLFIAKQAIDLYGEEDPSETSTDLVEYAAGIVIAKVIILLIL